MADKSSVIVHKAAGILEIHKRVAGKLEGYPETEKKRPDIAYELLKMLVLADELLECVHPSESAGQIHGLPKEAVAGSRKAYEFSNEIGWDFGPWFQEKAYYLKKGVLDLFMYWDMDPSEVTLVEDAPVTPVQWLKTGLEHGLSGVKAYAETIFNMTYNNKIAVEAEEFEF